MEWGRALTSHDTMATVALARLAAQGGWGEARVHAFAKGYREKLRPAPADAPPLADLARLDVDDAWALAGDYALLGDFTRWLAARIADEGPEAVTCEALARVGRGMPGAAGHGLLRVAYAFDLRAHVRTGTFARELARALGYFVARATPLAAWGGAAPARSLEVALAEVPPLGEARRAALRSLGLISLRQAALARAPSLAPMFADLGPPADLVGALGYLAGIAVEKPDFTLLHALTTGHAILTLEDALPGLDARELRVGWSHFVLAAALIEALPRGATAAPAQDAPSVGDLLTPLRTSPDDHAAKAAYSLLALHTRAGDPRFFASAKRYVDAFA